MKTTRTGMAQRKDESGKKALQNRKSREIGYKLRKPAR